MATARAKRIIFSLKCPYACLFVDSYNLISSINAINNIIGIINCKYQGHIMNDIDNINDKILQDIVINDINLMSKCH